MEIKIQIQSNLLPENVIGTYVSEEENPDKVIGKITSYDTLTGIAICEVIDKN